MNWDLLGHEWAVKFLAGQIAGGHLHHAYLITGPPGVGRRTLAARFAQAINCHQPPSPGYFCGECRACRGFAALEHPDLAVVQAETVGGTLKIGQVRDLGRFLSLAPFETRTRIALILRFEEAQKHAANALLKTLEEPNEKVILLLTAEAPEQVPETILSRCWPVRLRPLTVRALSAGLQSVWGISADQAGRIAHIAGGRPGLARRMLEDPEPLAARSHLLDEQARLFRENRAGRFDFAEHAAQDKVALRNTLEIWESYWRDVMIAASGSSAPLTNIDREDEIRELASSISPDSVRSLVGDLERTRERLDRNANPRLALETLMLSLPRLRVE